MKKLLLFASFSLVLLVACKKENFSEWLIPQDEVQDGGPGKDGIPSVDNPRFISVDEVDFLSDDDLIVGMSYKGVIKGYPHPIMDWHEIVNDEVDDRQIALTYCPLTGTAIAWNRMVDGRTTTFGVSGKLYNNNLIPYDRETDSYWSQINLNCVNGERIGMKAEIFPLMEMTWGSWKAMFPDSEVMSTETGFSRNYNNYPYGDYRTNNNSYLFPRNPIDDRLPGKERVLGILNSDNNKAYSITNFEEPKAIYDSVGGEDFIIIGSKEARFIVAFEDNGQLDGLTFNAADLPIIGTDANGNQLDISGEIVAGPLAGTKLDSPDAFIGYWFSFGAFYPGIEIY